MARPSSRSGAVADLFDAPEPDIKIKRAADRIIARNAAERLFRNIAREFGIDEAKSIFGELAKPVSKSQLEKLRNSMLLDLYESSGRPPIKKFARWLAKQNKTLPAFAKFGPRVGHSAQALDKQMRRLLKKKADHQ
jgi:hypothetical protein